MNLKEKHSKAACEETKNNSPRDGKHPKNLQSNNKAYNDLEELTKPKRDNPEPDTQQKHAEADIKDKKVNAPNNPFTDEVFAGSHNFPMGKKGTLDVLRKRQ